MNLKVKGLVLAAVAALVLNGCDSGSEQVDSVGKEMKKVLDQAGEDLGDIVKHSDATIEKKLENKFHLTHSDAVYVTEHNKAEADYVVNDVLVPVFADIKFKFSSTSTKTENTNATRVLGQIAFVLNSQEFQDRFDANPIPDACCSLGVDDAKMPPADFVAFKNVVNDRTQQWKDKTLLISIDGTNRHQAILGQPNLYLNKFEVQDTATLSSNAPLLLQRLTSAFGYSNDKAPDSIPYYVQLMTKQDGARKDDLFKKFFG
ncbi:hypothetical protein A9264_11745 [Vibrio sp. UCD-FRSSP16_10]|uniref:hypothetical protein n=1 Tax=unclassified Vibrio TaxID=2614977 RepID=UPI0007FC7402|nr:MULTISPECIES: hypothetical protein [unclassified Vibrio]OBT16306.1 hypothetical protein A9260_11955 [Vibrio sp. UCD-FRSSP16_30]OBT21171.1 hypothetical protein A9264_11745 [Vibrio sp. UCD-FRSSP16_10]